MSTTFLLSPNATTEYDANEYEKITKFDDRYIYFCKRNKPHKFGYCTCCGLKVFWTLPKKDGGSYFFRHEAGYYSETERIRMLSCDNYKPSKGVTGNPEKVTKDFLDDIFIFLKENGFWIYKYINKILGGNGYVNPEYLLECIKNIFIDNIDGLTTAHKLSERIIPYNILSLINDLNGNIKYEHVRPDTINLKFFIDKNNIKYYNYIHFSLYKDYIENNVMGVEVIKSYDHNTKTEVNPPKVLFVEKIDINKLGLFQYIEEQKKYEYKYDLSDDDIMNSKLKFKENIIKDKNIRSEITKALDEMFP